MSEMENNTSDFVIGKNLLENLTTGMYVDSKVIYREYIQNACDQIDIAIKNGWISPEEAEVSIWIDNENRNISIEDNATGVESGNFVEKLGSIANSDKKKGENKGFRGIGRLCGLAYCQTLVFTTSFSGEPIGSKLVFDAKLMRQMLDADEKETFDNVLKAITKSETFKEDKEKHYFKVELLGINRENTELLNEESVIRFLSFVAPVPYDKSKFLFYDKIYEHAKALEFTIDEYCIRVNGAPLFKQYINCLYESAGKEANSNKRKYDEIFDVVFKEFYDDNRLIAWMWYGLSKFVKVIPPAMNPMYGFRVRQGNIQIGNNSVVANLFKEDRGNKYFVGEIFTVDNKNLIPNSQRDYFNEGRIRTLLEDELKNFFWSSLHKLYHIANEEKSDLKKITSYEVAAAKHREKCKKGFVDKEEKECSQAQLEGLKKDAEKAKKSQQKRLDNDSLSPETRRVLMAINDDVKNNNEPKDRKNNEPVSTSGLKEEVSDEIDEEPEVAKIKYFTDDLSKLGRDKRKLVTKIMGIVKQIAPEDIADKIQAAIVEEFR